MNTIFSCMLPNPSFQSLPSVSRHLLAYNFGFVRESAKAYEEMANVGPEFHQTGVAHPGIFMDHSRTMSAIDKPVNASI